MTRKNERELNSTQRVSQANYVAHQLRVAAELMLRQQGHSVAGSWRQLGFKTRPNRPPRITETLECAHCADAVTIDTAPPEGIALEGSALTWECRK